jgi:DNA-binding MarR family transcriptional regulator
MFTPTENPANGNGNGAEGDFSPQLSKEAATIHLVDETIRLYFRLRHVADQIHRKGALSGGRRGFLRSLHAEGPQTVPDMARARAVTRQNAQVFVNSLLEEGLVEKIPNPAHKRSHLIELTDRGRDALDEMNRREFRLVEKLDLGLSGAELKQAAEVLRTLRESFESAGWEKLVSAEGGSSP